MSGSKLTPPTQAEIKANPSLLLHKRSELEGQPIRAFDGLVAALIDDGQFVVTSPNVKKIYNPPLGGDRAVFLRSNLRYGDDDPIMWPQNFLPTLAHLALIPFPPRDRNDPMSILWSFPLKDDFVPEGSLLGGLGRLKDSYIARLRMPCSTLLRQAEQHKSEPRAQILSSLIESFLTRLSHLPASFRANQLLVRETQRMALELLACLDFYEIYRPRQVENKPVEPGTKPARIIGAFTTSLQTCEELFRLNIPVYLIRPLKEVTGMRIREVVTPIIAEHCIPLDEALNPSYPAVFRGRVSPAKYHAMFLFTRRLQSYPNPFGLVCAPPRADPLPPTSAQINRKARSQMYSPYARRTKPQSAFYEPAGRDKFEDPNDPIYPPPIPAWRDALRDVDRSLSALQNIRQSYTDSNYAFPEPASLIAFEKKERRNAAFRSWLRYRDAMIHRFMTAGSDARPMAGKAWRMLLSMDYLERPGSTSRTDTKSAKLRDSLNDFLQNTTEMGDGITLDVGHNGAETWRGKPFDTLEDPDLEEIIWELAELNFRQELLALDSRVSPTTVPYPSDRQDLVCKCFPSGQLLFAPISEANHGIASYDSQEQCRYLLGLQRLMKDWPGQKPEIMNVNQVRWQEGDTKELEKGVAQFYTQTFFNHFKRAPVIPRRLSHNVPGLVIPPPALEHLNPTPMIYYDMDLILERENGSRDTH